MLAGCSSVRTQVNTGVVKARTFSYVAPPPPHQSAFADNRPDVHKLIQRAITHDLAAKGLTRTETGGDVTVAYLVIIGNNVTTTSVDDYFGYGRDSSELVDQVHQQQAVKSADPNYFEAGTLVLDIVDARSHKLLYRSSVRRQLLRDLSSDARAERIQQVVDAALANLRVSS